MNNKTTFQEKNTRLNQNNSNLSSILSTINNLPSVGSGGTTEIWTFTMEDGSTVTKEVVVE